MLHVLAALLGIAPQPDLAPVSNPEGVTRAICAADVTEEDADPARPLYVSERGEGVFVSATRPSTGLSGADIERLRVAIFDEALFGEQFARDVGWFKHETWDERLITDAEVMATGTFVAVNGGKYGGGLIWLTASDIKLIYQVQTNGLARDEEAILAATGSSRGFGGPAAIVRVEIDDGVPEITMRYATPVTVRDVAVRDGLIVAVGRLGPMVIDEGDVMHHPAASDADPFFRTRPDLHPSRITSVIIDEHRRTWVGAKGQYVIYSDLPHDFTPHAFALDDCAG